MSPEVLNDYASKQATFDMAKLMVDLTFDFILAAMLGKDYRTLQVCLSASAQQAAPLQRSRANSINDKICELETNKIQLCLKLLRSITNIPLHCNI